MTEEGHIPWSLELLVQGRIGYSGLLAKCIEAETNAEDGSVPIVVAKSPRLPDKDSLVVFRLGEFMKHFDLTATLEGQEND